MLGDLRLRGRHPGTCRRGDEGSGRAKSNLSRTLCTVEKYGLVELAKGKDCALIPRVRYNRIQLDMSLGHGDEVEA